MSPLAEGGKWLRDRFRGNSEREVIANEYIQAALRQGLGRDRHPVGADQRRSDLAFANPHLLSLIRRQGPRQELRMTVNSRGSGPGPLAEKRERQRISRLVPAAVRTLSLRCSRPAER